MGLSIAAGWFVLLGAVTGAAALLVVAVGRGRSWYRRRLPAGVLAGLAVTTAVTLYADHVWHPFPDPLPWVVVLWTGMTLVTMAVALLHRSGRARVAGVALGLIVAVCGGIQVNASFGTYPTLAAAFGEPLPGQVDSSTVLGHDVPVAAVADGGPLDASWRPAAPVATNGEVTTATIPGTVSGFRARPAWIYLPPAYQADPRPLLPVLILLSGQPGEPRNWFDGSHVPEIMDAWAARHGGLAPVVVVPDWIGTAAGNPLCVDSAAAGADYTYLTRDVPDWIRGELEVDPRPTRWAVGGLSAGATCAGQLAVNDPAQFPTFLFFSGQTEPTLSDRADTVATLFDGDEAAFVRINPLDVLRTRSFAGSAAVFAAGARDGTYGPQTRAVRDAALAAGVDARYLELPGGHDSPFWAAALAGSMDWLGTRLQLTG
ncbi:alpha/beta hydrolase [Nakamurella deserti]|uniref:alpha/beta hydrolase n=1 Tax=Nakamurella deserti TaxID=2164074 RepID=UPI0013008822|nr:alpha/beta hydrolase-fold protein [Nakamurella deserti]